MACDLCERDVASLTRHHLVPKDEGGTGGETADLCGACHRQIHALYDNRTLAREMGSIPALRAAPEMRRFLRWVRRQDPGRRIRVRRPAGRRR